MATKYSNPCTRCGKERIKLKEWKEKVTTFWGTSEIIYEETVCPDPECQKIVEQKLKAEKDKKESLEFEREERARVNKEKRSKLKKLTP